MKNEFKKVLIMFVMSFTLLFSVSSAEIIQPNITYNKTAGPSTTWTSMFGYSHSHINEIVNNYFLNGDEEPYNTLLNTIVSNNFYYVVVNSGRNSSKPYGIYFWSNEIVDCGFDENSGVLFINAYTGSNVGYQVYYADYAPSGSSTCGCYCNYILFKEYPVVETNFPIKSVTCPTVTSAIWDGVSYFGSSSSNIPQLTDDELASIINTFINSEDFLSNRPSGYDDFFITYNTISEQYYAFLYKSTLDLAMTYGSFDENGKFEPSGLSTDEGYKIFWYTRDNNIFQELWNNLQWIFSPSEYLCFRINPSINKVHYIATYNDATWNSDSDMLFTTAEESIVYSSKDIHLMVKNNDGYIAIDETNSYKEDILLNSSTNEEYVFNLPTVSVSETPWSRFINLITFIPSKIADAIANKMGFNKVMFILSPLFETIYEILGVFLACLAFIGRAITFVYTLPTIEASSALFNVDVATSSKGLAFSGNTWGTHFLSGLDKLKAYSWNGITLWSFFEAFVLALVAVIAIKLVRKHYHM